MDNMPALNLQKLNRLLLFAGGILFSMYFLGMQWYNRPALEEDIYLCSIKTNGAWLFYSHFLNTIGGRWSGMAVLTGVYSIALKFSSPSDFLFFYFFVLYTTLVCALYFFLKTTYFVFFQLTEQVIPLLSQAMLFATALYFGAPQVTESWYYISATFIYILPLVACIALVTLLMKKSTDAKSILILSSLSLFIGGDSETFSFPLLFILVSILFFYSFKKQKFTLLFYKTDSGIKIIFASVFLFTGVFVNLSLPGNSSRMIHEVKHNNLRIMAGEQPPKTSFYENKTILETIFQSKNRMWIFLLIPFAFAGAGIKNEINTIQFTSKILLILAFSILACAIIMVPVMEIVFGNLGPLRSWMNISALITFVIFFLFLFTGRKLNSFFNPNRIFFTLVSLAIIFQIGKHIVWHFPHARNYAVSYDKRVSKLRELNSAGIPENYILEPLADEWLYVSASNQGNNKNKINRNFACAIGITLLPLNNRK